jgi:hypothetical protein
LYALLYIGYGHQYKWFNGLQQPKPFLTEVLQALAGLNNFLWDFAGQTQAQAQAPAKSCYVLTCATENVFGASFDIENLIIKGLYGSSANNASADGLANLRLSEGSSSEIKKNGNRNIAGVINFSEIENYLRAEFLDYGSKAD